MKPGHDQIKFFLALMDGKRYSHEHPAFNAAIDWTAKLPPGLSEVERQIIRGKICETFELTEPELDKLVFDVQIMLGIETNNDKRKAQELEDELNQILPRRGYFRKHVEYTSRSEAPLAFHFFSALAAIAATIGRRVHLDMGYYKLYPPTGVFILGPSGLKKTSAANIATDTLRELACTKIYSEKVTPEALTESMKNDATGLVYAPEMAVFLGRQDYMRGIIPLLTRFMDCPDHWVNETIGKSKRELFNVAITCLMCSTPDWFISAVPEDVFGGGFIARNILVVQNDTPRCEPRPIPGDPSLKRHLVEELALIHAIEGEMTRSKAQEKRYDDWYRQFKEETKNPEHELLGTYYQRKPDHIQRTAICLHLASHGTMELCTSCFEEAVAIINWIDQFVPPLLQQMFKSGSGQERELVLRTLRAHGGYMHHSYLLRKLSYKLNATQVRAVIGSLREEGTIVEENTNLGHIYALREVVDEKAKAAVGGTQ